MTQKTLNDFIKEKITGVNKNISFYKEIDFKETPIGKIPKDWEVVRLTEICMKIKAGGTPLTSKKEFWNGNIPFVKIEDITSAGKYLSKTNTSISELGLKNSNAWIVPEKSLLLAMYGSVGEVSINTIPVATNQAILGIIPKNKDDVEFLYYWYLYFKPNWKRYAKTTTQANLTAHIVRNSIVPLPSPSERKVIVEILSTLDDAIEATEKYIRKLERLKRGLMQKVLMRGIRCKEFKETPIGKIPKDWEVVRLKDIFTYIKGRKPDALVNERKDNYLPYLTTDYLRTEKPSNYVKPGKNTIIVNDNDIILLWDGSNAGEVFLGRRGVLASTMVKLVPKDKNINTKFYFYHLKILEPYLKSLTKGTGIPHVDKVVFENLYLVRPPLEEQKYISTILLTMDKWIELEKRRKEKLESLKRGLMESLLTGKIRVKVN